MWSKINNKLVYIFQTSRLRLPIRTGCIIITDKKGNLYGIRERPRQSNSQYLGIIGGQVEAEDVSVKHTALREFVEECIYFDSNQTPVIEYIHIYNKIKNQIINKNKYFIWGKTMHTCIFYACLNNTDIQTLITHFNLVAFERRWFINSQKSPLRKREHIINGHDFLEWIDTCMCFDSVPFVPTDKNWLQTETHRLQYDTHPLQTTQFSKKLFTVLMQLYNISHSIQEIKHSVTNVMALRQICIYATRLWSLKIPKWIEPCFAFNVPSVQTNSVYVYACWRAECIWVIKYLQQFKPWIEDAFKLMFLSVNLVDLISEIYKYQHKTVYWSSVKMYICELSKQNLNHEFKTCAGEQLAQIFQNNLVSEFLQYAPSDHQQNIYDLKYQANVALSSNNECLAPLKTYKLFG